MPEEGEAPENHLLHMGSHHQVCVDENTQITHRLNWVDRGAVDDSGDMGSWCWHLVVTHHRTSVLSELS